MTSSLSSRQAFEASLVDQFSFTNSNKIYRYISSLKSSKSIPEAMRRLTAQLQHRMAAHEETREACRRCVGSDAGALACRNRDCANLYLRHTAAAGLGEAARDAARVEAVVEW